MSPATAPSTILDAEQPTPSRPAVQPSLASAASLRDVEALVVGAGPAGMRAAARLAARGVETVVLNAESVEPYNRVKLTPLLAGDVQLSRITVEPPRDGAPWPTLFNGVRATRIDREARVVETSDGRAWRYASLVLATGSTAFIPKIPGRDLPGVYAFRDAADVSALIARSFRARRVVVVGGGLLGLEAARGMRARGAEVVVVEHENRLMPRQLDEAAAERLAAQIKALNVEARTGVAVARIDGEAWVERVELRDGAVLPCDSVIICTGVRANAGLARSAGLKTGRGVLVDDALRTSDPAIYAVGECAEHRGQVYGLVGPGLEQADIAADAITGDATRYAGSTPATKLKVIGVDVFSIGDFERLELDPNTRSHVWVDDAAGLYRRIFLTRGRLTGALAIGDWPEASRIQQAALRRLPVFPWMLYRFRRDGALWSATPGSAAALPAQAVVCNCTGVTAGRLRAALAEGERSVPALKAATGASTVCGSCQPLIEELIEAGAPPKPVRLWKPLLALSLIGALLALAQLFAPRIPAPDAFGAHWTEALWFDNLNKQWSGYSLLAISVAGLVIGLRKRLGFMRGLGGYDWWRLTHLAIGFAAALGLFVHTGFRPGENLNFWLFLSFSLTLLFGAVAGLATGGEHRLRAQGVGSSRTPPRLLPTWLHILAIWPLPALLIAHVLVVYAY